MSNLIPLPAPIPMPPPFVVPDPELALPNFRVPEWEPVPIYREDVPALNPKPAPEDQRPENPPSQSTGAPNPAEGVPPADIPTSMPEVPTTELPPLPTQEPTNVIEIPGGFEIPVPPREILVTAITTAGAASVVSVGATMAATNLFKRIVSIAKPVIKAALKKIAKLTGKKPPLTWSRQRQLELRQHIRDRKHSRGGS